MKKLFFFAAATALLAACSQTDELSEVTKTAQQAEETPVDFEVYTNKATTRAGAAGIITDADFKDPSKPVGAAGFGVFAYYTDDEAFTQLATPNFMYNQQVKYNTTATAWSYYPVKYWPNEYGDNAISAAVDYLSIFAYAPYVEVDAVSGYTTDYAGDPTKKKNIVRLSKNALTGDPFVHYVVDFEPKTSVDLLWGVQADATTYKPIENTLFTFKKGMPYLNCVKDQVDGKIKFQFQHALARLDATIQADVDVATKSDADTDKQVGTNADGTVDGTSGEAISNSKTRIYVRSIEIEGLANEGLLDLNNTAVSSDKGLPLWKDIHGMLISPTENFLRVYDGRLDGSEANAANANEFPTGLNIKIVQSAPYSGTITDGVTKAEIPLFGDGTSAATSSSIFAIPTGKVDPKITIVYDVETRDDNVAGFLSDGVTHGSVVENKISKAFLTSGKMFEAGKKYNLKIYLGMTSVKFDVEVLNWDETDAGSGVDLPANKTTAP